MTQHRMVAIKFGLFSIVPLVLLLLLVNTLSNKVDGATRDYHAVFENVSGLRVGDDVRVAGVRVGRVDSIELAGTHAEVGFRLQADQHLFAGTRAVMRYQNLLGQRYVLLTRDDLSEAGPDRRLPDGATIPLSRTSPGFDLTTLLNGFRPLFKVLDPSEINQLSRSTIAVLQGEGGSVAQLLAETTRLTTYVADRDKLLGEVAVNLTPVLANLARHGKDLRLTVHELATLVSGLSRNRDAIGRAVDHLGGLFARASVLLEETRRPLGRDIRTLREVYAMYVANRKAFEKALPGVAGILESLARTFSYRSAQTVYTCDIGVGTPDTGFVGPGAVTKKYSEVCR